MSTARLFALTGTCGAGKTTLAEAIARDLTWVERLVSYTTRKRYEWEDDGHEYHFVSRDEYQRLCSNHALIGCSELYGNCYGASAEDVRKVFAKGKCALVTPDVHAALSIRQQYYPQAVVVFVMAPNLTILRTRIVQRGTDPMGLRRQKMAAAKEELKVRGACDHVVVNDDFETALCEVKRIMKLHASR